jgi:hypothetical protein
VGGGRKNRKKGVPSWDTNFPFTLISLALVSLFDLRPSFVHIKTDVVSGLDAVEVQGQKPDILKVGTGRDREDGSFA